MVTQMQIKSAALATELVMGQNDRNAQSPPDRLALAGYALALLLVIGWLTSVNAQTVRNIDIPDLKPVDHVGVNLINGYPSFTTRLTQIGPQERRLDYTFEFSQLAVPVGIHGSYNGFVVPAYSSTPTGIRMHPCPGQPEGCPVYIVRLWGEILEFYLQAGTYKPTRPDGTMLQLMADGTYQLTKRDGTRYRTAGAAMGHAVVKVEAPDGMITSIQHESATYVDSSGHSQIRFRVRSVSRSDGYMLRFAYHSNTSAAQDLWYWIQEVKAINLAIDYCDPAAAVCSYSRAWPTATTAAAGDPLPAGYSGARHQTILTDAAGQARTFTNAAQNGASRIVAVKEPASESGNTTTYEYLSYLNVSMYSGLPSLQVIRPLLVRKATRGGADWTYSYTNQYVGQASNDPDAAVYHWWHAVGIGPDGYQASLWSNAKMGGISVLTAGNEQVGFDVATGRALTHRDKEGRRFEYAYDDRGNVQMRTQLPRVGSALPPLVQSAGFDATCTNTVKCNKPNWKRDAKNAQTDYVYDSTHGGLLRELLPADSDGVRPVKRYTYVQRHAWIRNSSGGYSQVPTPVWLLESERTCVSGATSADGTSCLAGPELVTLYEYGPNAGPNNLLVRGRVVIGDGQSLRTCYTYDALGNRTSETTARAGLASCP